jgi:hypothetical protein
MMKTVMSAALGLAMLLLGSATTWAADMCLLDEDGLGVMVGKNFSFPGAGACKAFNGYLLGSDVLISGAACGTSDNVDIRFNLNYSVPDGRFGVAAIYIDRFNSTLDQAGFGYYCQADRQDGGWICTQAHYKQISCPSPRPLN